MTALFGPNDTEARKTIANAMRHFIHCAYGGMTPDAMSRMHETLRAIKCELPPMNDGDEYVVLPSHQWLGEYQTMSVLCCPAWIPDIDGNSTIQYFIEFRGADWALSASMNYVSANRMTWMPSRQKVVLVSWSGDSAKVFGGLRILMDTNFPEPKIVAPS